MIGWKDRAHTRVKAALALQKGEGFLYENCRNTECKKTMDTYSRKY
ncbi:MAG: hypothetical protein K0R67_466 [Paenibacillus sp.]|nr:hypothetical protein [Paenibacillus sp.]